VCGVGERSPAALPSPPAPPPALGAILREKIYGHANYPLKLRETKPPVLPAHLPRRPQGPSCAAIAEKFENSARKTILEEPRSTSVFRLSRRIIAIGLLPFDPFARAANIRTFVG